MKFTILITIFLIDIFAWNTTFLIDFSASMDTASNKQVINKLIKSKLKAGDVKLYSFSNTVKRITTDDSFVEFSGGTNLSNALEKVTNDINTSIIYLISDGMPNSSENVLSVYNSIKNRVRICTIFLSDDNQPPKILKDISFKIFTENELQNSSILHCEKIKQKIINDLNRNKFIENPEQDLFFKNLKKQKHKGKVYYR